MLELFYRGLITLTFTFLPDTHLLKELKKKKRKELTFIRVASKHCTVLPTTTTTPKFTISHSDTYPASTRNLMLIIGHDKGAALEGSCTASETPRSNSHLFCAQVQPSSAQQSLVLLIPSIKNLGPICVADRKKLRVMNRAGDPAANTGMCIKYLCSCNIYITHMNVYVQCTQTSREERE